MVGVLSDIGNYRKVNQDYADYYEDKFKKVYVMADGMGGHNAGEIASKIAVETIIQQFKNHVELLNEEEMLSNSIRLANREIYEQALSSDELSGMGTTITACVVKKYKMVVANVGDSSCYVLKKNGIFKITKDHSLVQQLIDSGSITEQEALKHPNKNIITRALGTHDTVMVDMFHVDLSDVQKVLLCTDGLSNFVTNEEMYDLLWNNTNVDACSKLVELSKLKGSRDNVSIIVFGGECENGWDDAR
ncbi:MAG: Stp1/IreP family PP2C-type Ser/Thr phosphatase [Bacillota bacterium]|nr:Stp1/IreP family PP2C-type Ser/Thr phosphatase [Bacillota bacterium]